MQVLHHIGVARIDEADKVAEFDGVEHAENLFMRGADVRHGTRLLQLRHDFGADDGIFVEHDNLYPGEILCRQRSEIGERVVRAHDGADARRCDGHEVEP